MKKILYFFIACLAFSCQDVNLEIENPDELTSKFEMTPDEYGVYTLRDGLSNY